MPLFAAILSALLPPFLLILLGYLLKRARVLHPAHVPILNGLVINVTLPALVLLGLLQAPALSPQLALLPLALLGAEAAAMGMAFLGGRLLRLPRPLQGAVLLTGVFGNTGFIGYPLTLALAPAQFPGAILMDQFGMTVPLYAAAAVLGAAFGGGDANSRASLLRFFRMPIFLSAALGLLLRQIPLPSGLLEAPAVREIGSVLTRSLEALGQGTTPLVLLALGVALRPGAARGRLSPLALAAGCKLAVTPLVFWGLCVWLSVPPAARAAGVLEAAMPTAVMASVLSGQNDMEGDFAVGVVFVTTLLSAVTVPILLTALR